MTGLRSIGKPLAVGLATGLLALGGPAAAAQDMARVRTTIRQLTAPRLHGRGYVRHGDQLAAAYVQRRFRQLGLQPLAPDFLQPFLLSVNTFPGQLQLQLTTPGARPIRLRPGLDFIAAATSGSGLVHGPLVYLDSTVLADAEAQHRFLRLTTQPGLVVLQSRTARQLPQYPAAIRQRVDSAAALITLVSKLTASLAPVQSRQVRLEALPQPALLAAATRPTNASVQVQARLLERYSSQNVVGFLPGRIQPDSFLVVSAHYDHLGRMGRHTFFPGANDNASGTAMLLELAAHYARPENRPAYSLVFLACGGEEAGLVGSTYFTEHSPVPLSRIRFLVNLDLVGTGDEGLTVVNGRLLPAAFQQLQRLNETGRYVPSVAARGRAANSDHFPFSERGVPAFFVYTRGGISAYHDVQDRPETLPLTAFSGVYSLLREFLNGLGAHSAN
ncbi:M28 family metallopeptidase [Hymenobacter weizhouensis]|uniref:M28 family metallopeptidase n=1 Tax=Hymenobacter sp. YIM 151500-1 TaxID=2987689 RepID=UPI002225EC4B|nr:M28 family peptidase [Hymenobacter sp. YIM 151500-1]UYZ62733.1 M28 family peptidase [Hymenobacter sp. YIM 151500-1]